MTWISCLIQKPEEGKIVQTCVVSNNGIHNEQPLIRKGNLWFHEDMGMYVYYNPSHWKPLDSK